MAAGQRRHHVALQEPTTTIVSGDSSTTWTTRAMRWVSIEPLVGVELWRARQVQPNVTHRIGMPWESTLALNTRWRILFEDRVLELLSVLRSEERRREWEMMAKEAV